MKKRVMIVEDEMFVGMDIAEQLIEDGFDAVGPFETVADAMFEFEANGCDAVVLDVKLKAETSEVFADLLSTHDIPFVIISGYTEDQFPSAFEGAISLLKPVNVSSLVDALHDVM